MAMEFIDYVTLLLINMAAGLTVLAAFLMWGLEEENRVHWAPAFGISGLVATVGGGALTFTWPLPHPYSIPYGELSVLLGVLFLGAAWSLAKGWNLLPLTIYAFFGGLVSVLMGIRFIHLSLTEAPVISGIGFILTGMGGLFAGMTLRLKKVCPIRWIGALMMLAAAFLWLWTALMAYWMHVSVSA